MSALKDSDVFRRVMDAETQLRKVDDRLLLSWFIRREYKPEEIEAGELFRLFILYSFEPAGEEFGVIYLPDVHGPAESTNRIGPLILKCSRFRGKSLCQSIANEQLVSPELQSHIRANGFTGAQFGPVICRGAETSKPGWAELIVTSKRVSVSPRTLTGDDLFNFGPGVSRDDSENIGLNLLSEVYVKRETWDGSDVAVSKQIFGAHHGYLRPRRVPFVSRRFFDSLSPEMRRGLDFEIVRFA